MTPGLSITPPEAMKGASKPDCEEARAVPQMIAAARARNFNRRGPHRRTQCGRCRCLCRRRRRAIRRVQRQRPPGGALPSRERSRGTRKAVRERYGGAGWAAVPRKGNELDLVSLVRLRRSIEAAMEATDGLGFEPTVRYERTQAFQAFSLGR